MELFVSFSEFMHFFKKTRVKFLLVVLLFGVLCGLLPLKLHQLSYSGHTTIAVSCEVPDNADTDYRLQYTNILYSRVQTVVAMANANSLLEKTAEKVGVDSDDISKITAEQLNSSPLVKITVNTPDADNAAVLSDTAAQILADQLVEKFPSPKLTVTITDKSIPAKNKSKKAAVVKAAILGLILGFILYVCYGLIVVLTDRTVRNGRFAEESLHTTMLAEIPHAAREPFRSNAFRRMRAAALHQAGEAKSFLVTGVCESDRAASASAGFAVALAQAGKKVLAVDANLRSPKLSQIFGVSAKNTFLDVLSGSCPLPQAAVDISQQPGLSLLAGKAVENRNPADLFAGPEFGKFLAEAQSSYDYIVVFAPSEMRFPDAENMASVLQAVIVSARYGATPFDQMRETFHSMKSAGGKVIGFVMTDA
jgi:Mrp family chromosome partitioning ATPase